MSSATRITVSTFGAIAGLAGIEHGIGEILQGNAAPEGVMILSWPDSELFAILDGEPAMTIIPNFLVTGVLAILLSLIFLAWSTMPVERKRSGLVLILLSILMLLAGAGFGPPMLGVILGVAAMRMNAPQTRRRAFLPDKLRRFLARLWLWCFVVAVISWLMLMPGTMLLDYFFGVSNPDMVVSAVGLPAFGFLLLTIFTGFARDTRRVTAQWTLSRESVADSADTRERRLL